MIKKIIRLLAEILIGLCVGQSYCQSAATLLAKVPQSGGSINVPGSYYLGYDITGDLIIDGSNIIVDLNGHRITGSITIAQLNTNVTVMNGFVISNQNVTAITVASTCTNIQLNDLSIRQFGDSGIDVNDGTNISIKKITIDIAQTANSGSIQLSGCSKAIVSNCVVGGTASMSGIAVVNSSRVLIQDCCVNNMGSDFTIGNNSSSITVSNCFAVQGPVGFHVTQSESSIKFFRCIAVKNSNVGFLVDEDAQQPVYLEECMANSCFTGFKIFCRKPHLIKKCLASACDNGFFADDCGDFNKPVQFRSNFADDCVFTYNSGGTPFNPIHAADEWKCKCEDILGICVKNESKGAQFWRNVTRPLQIL